MTLETEGKNNEVNQERDYQVMRSFYSAGLSVEMWKSGYFSCNRDLALAWSAGPYDCKRETASKGDRLSLRTTLPVIPRRHSIVSFRNPLGFFRLPTLSIDQRPALRRPFSICRRFDLRNGWIEKVHARENAACSVPWYSRWGSPRIKNWSPFWTRIYLNLPDLEPIETVSEVMVVERSGINMNIVFIFEKNAFSDWDSDKQRARMRDYCSKKQIRQNNSKIWTFGRIVVKSSVQSDAVYCRAAVVGRAESVSSLAPFLIRGVETASTEHRFTYFFRSLARAFFFRSMKSRIAFSAPFAV